MEIKIRPARPRDVDELVQNLLPADRTEVLALGFDPRWAIENCLKTAIEAVAISKGGKLACIVGVSRRHDLAEDVEPWLLSTPVILAHPRDTLHVSKLILERWLKTYPSMSNYVDTRHKRAVRWLVWLGAKLEPAAPHGPYGRLFHKFTFGAS
jgi:hypothetical protein